MKNFWLIHRSRFFILFTLFCLSIQPANSQVIKNFGISSGLNVTKLRFNNTDAINDLIAWLNPYWEKGSLKLSTYSNIGLTYEWKLKKYLNIEPESGYYAQVFIFPPLFWISPDSHKYARRHYSYLQLNLKLSPKARILNPFISFGPGITCLMDHSADVIYGGPHMDFPNFYHRLTLNISTGFGIEIMQLVSLKMEYIPSLTRDINLERPYEFYAREKGRCFRYGLSFFPGRIK